ncbi:hypothetical protein TIFTF001_013274 [Ficus carica]|uniref:Bet v I/Major latex protein domain-containing protein n=1 Tax=Ficus carica TaxID=3494 RepID=A0AA88A1U2_FICCA|nr:hypothetical protein TIFTF001_013274 [Ficus carica]
MLADLCGKLETDVEIKASAEKFHSIFRHKPHHISNVASHKIQGVDLHEGEWGTVGSIVCWNYFHDGKPRVARDRVEAIDEEKNLITFRVLEGDLREHFKSFVITIQANPKVGGEGCTVHWILEYEKLHAVPRRLPPSVAAGLLVFSTFAYPPPTPQSPFH